MCHKVLCLMVKIIVTVNVDYECNIMLLYCKLWLQEGTINTVRCYNLLFLNLFLIMEILLLNTVSSNKLNSHCVSALNCMADITNTQHEGCTEKSDYGGAKEKPIKCTVLNIISCKILIDNLWNDSKRLLRKSYPFMCITVKNASYNINYFLNNSNINFLVIFQFLSNYY